MNKKNLEKWKDDRTRALDKMYSKAELIDVLVKDRDDAIKRGESRLPINKGMTKAEAITMIVEAEINRNKATEDNPVKITFVVLQENPDGTVDGMFFKNGKLLKIKDNLFTRASRVGLIKNKVIIIEGDVVTRKIDTMPEALKDQIRKVIGKLPSVKDIIKMDIAANIITPELVPVIFNASTRCNRAPRARFKYGSMT